MQSPFKVTSMFAIETKRGIRNFQNDFLLKKCFHYGEMDKIVLKTYPNQMN